jgi:glucokinase
MAKIGIGVDVGGTSVKLGMFTRSGNLIKKWEIPTDRENDCANVLPDVAASIRKTLEEEGFTLEDLAGVGLGVPGPVQPTGYVEVCVNLHWRDRYPGRELSELLDGVRVEAGNDANVAALGEAWKGGGGGADDAVLFTLGTGVGGGVIVDGKIITGKHGLGGELGHMHVRDEETEFCNCGGRGCLEQVASATGIVREAKRILKKSDADSKMRQLGDLLTARDVCDLGREGDLLADEVMETVSRYLGLAISHVEMTVDPDVFIIGGGVSRAGSYLLEKIRKYYNDYTTLSRNHGNVVLAALGNDAGIYGAVRLVLEKS